MSTGPAGVTEVTDYQELRCVVLDTVLYLIEN